MSALQKWGHGHLLHHNGSWILVSGSHPGLAFARGDGLEFSNTMEASWVVETLDSAIRRHGRPEIINSDLGSQFISYEYVAFAKEHGIQISMVGKGRAIDNVIVERSFRKNK